MSLCVCVYVLVCVWECVCLGTAGASGRHNKHRQGWVFIYVSCALNCLGKWSRRTQLNSEIINVIDNSLIIFYFNLLSLQTQTGNCLGWVFKLKLNWTLPVSVDNCLAHCAYARCSHVECVLHTHLHATNVSLSSLQVCLTIWLSVSVCLSVCLAYCN